MGSFRDFRAYRKLPAEWREIVFYSESGQDWHHLAPLIEELTGTMGRKVTYVTSDRADPGLMLKHVNFKTLCIREGWFLTIHFNFQKAGVVVLTMMDLGNLQLKRSINAVKYVYVFHSMGSTHMVDHANSYDAYDSFLCVGPHHVEELRKREALQGMAPREMFEYGYPRLEALIEEGEAGRNAVREDGEPVVLIAPTWGDDSIFNRCGRELIAALLDAGNRVIMRPHYHTRRLTPEVLDSLIAEFGDHQRFEVIEQMGETQSLFRSDLLVCDWSAMAIEYAFGRGKPVLFIDLPRRIRNPDWELLEIEPFEVTIREQVGEVLAPEDVGKAPEAVQRLLADRTGFRERMQSLRQEKVFNLGHCVPVGAREIARLADMQKDTSSG